MKMNKFMLSFFIVLTLVIGFSIAGLMPYAISGHVIYNDIPLSEVEITIRNNDINFGTNYFTTTTDKEGFFIGTLGNAVDWGKYDEIEVIACSTQINSFCKQVKRIERECPVGGGCTFDYTLKSESVIIKDGEEVTVKDIIYVCEDGTEVDDKEDCKEDEDDVYVCWDGTQVNRASQCPVKDDDETVYVCPDGSEVSDKSLCPKDEDEDDISIMWKYMFALIITILSAFGWGKGFTGLANYWWRRGEEAIRNGDKKQGVAYQKRAISMAKTAVNNALAGKYGKDVGR